MIWLFVMPLFLLLAFTIWNAIEFRSLKDFTHTTLTQTPRVSVLVPARNEETNLKILLPTLTAQDYPNLEIIVLNDHSTDNTRAVAQSFTNKRLRVIDGGELLTGWMGKPNACQQLAAAATGDILIFTDADTIWQPNTVKTVVQAFQVTHADALSVWPEQLLQGMLSRLMQPFMAWSLLALLPIRFVPNPRFPLVVSANGQLMAFTRACFTTIDGFSAVRNNVVEDMALARVVNQAGFSFWLLNGVGSIKCKMYASSKDVFNGFAKAAFVNLGANPLAAIAAMLAFAWLFIAPWLWLIANLIFRIDLTWAMTAVLLSVLTRVVTDLRFGYSPVLAFLQPFSVIAWISILIASWRSYAAGNVSWKGRVYDLRDSRNSDSKK